MILWNGTCEVHDIIQAEQVIKMKEKNPDALLIAHPECQGVILELADYVGSTTGLLNFTIKNPAKKFIVATETGIIYQMKKSSPEKEFLIVPRDKTCSCNDCPYMKLNTVDAVRRAQAGAGTVIDYLTPAQMDAARLPIERMLEFSQQRYRA